MLYWHSHILVIDVFIIVITGFIVQIPLRLVSWFVFIFLFLYI